MPTPTDALRLPVAWVHVPKTGTSFLNALLPNLCEPPIHHLDENATHGGVQHAFWKTRMHLSQCNFTSAPQFAKGYSSPPGHMAYGKYAEQHAGHGVMLLRQPEQRIISGWHHDWHSYKPYSWYSPRHPDLPTYASAVEGCTVRMLTRRSDGEACGVWPLPSAAELKEALRLLRGFQFVGLTEDWDTTICLWRRRYGAGRHQHPDACHPAEFLNMRPGTPEQHGRALTYDVAPLRGFRDRFDGPLYEEARRLFDAELARANLTREGCAAWKTRCLADAEARRQGHHA